MCDSTAQFDRCIEGDMPLSSFGVRPITPIAQTPIPIENFFLGRIKFTQGNHVSKYIRPTFSLSAADTVSVAKNSTYFVK
jgi:hypothetical protein